MSLSLNSQYTCSPFTCDHCGRKWAPPTPTEISETRARGLPVVKSAERFEWRGVAAAYCSKECAKAKYPDRETLKAEMVALLQEGIDAVYGEPVEGVWRIDSVLHYLRCYEQERRKPAD